MTAGDAASDVQPRSPGAATSKAPGPQAQGRAGPAGRTRGQPTHPPGAGVRRKPGRGRRRRDLRELIVRETLADSVQRAPLDSAAAPSLTKADLIEGEAIAIALAQARSLEALYLSTDESDSKLLTLTPKQPV
jgi:hypothetical protein